MSWFITDDDCLQCCRCDLALYPSVFELVQINSYSGHVDGKPFYQVAHAHIDMKDYTEQEILDALGAYGYKDMDDFVFQNSPTKEFIYLPDGTLDKANSPSYIIDYQLIAEMLFELEVQEYVDEEYSTWNAAVERVSTLTGLDLHEYREEEAVSDRPVDHDLIFGEYELDGKRRAFISTPTELAEVFHLSANQLVKDLLQAKNAFGKGVYAVYVKEQTRFSLRIADRVLSNAKEAAAYIASSIQHGNYQNFLTPTPDTCRSMCHLFRPFFEAGLYDAQRDHNVMQCNAFANKHPAYLKDLLTVFGSYHLLDMTRDRPSATQGSVLVSCAGKDVVRYKDDMFLRTHNGSFSDGFRMVANAQHYGPVIGDWGSILPDEDFLKAALTQYPQRICRCLEDPALQKSHVSSLNDQLSKASAKKLSRKRPASARLKRIESER